MKFIKYIIDEPFGIFEFLLIKKMNKLQCLWHKLPFSQVIINQGDAELLCEECYMNLVDDEKQIDLNTIVYLKKVKSINIQANKCPTQLLSMANI